MALTDTNMSPNYSGNISTVKSALLREDSSLYGLYGDDDEAIVTLDHLSRMIFFYGYSTAPGVLCMGIRNRLYLQPAHHLIFKQSHRRKLDIRVLVRISIPFLGLGPQFNEGYPNGQISLPPTTMVSSLGYCGGFDSGGVASRLRRGFRVGIRNWRRPLHGLPYQSFFRLHPGGSGRCILGVDLAAIGQYGAAEQSYLKALNIK